MKELLNLKFKYTEKEYVEAVRWHYSNKLNVKLDIVLSIASILLGIYFINIERDFSFGITFIILGCLLISMMVFVLFINPRRYFRQEPKFHEEYELDFNDEGILFKTEHINSSISWSHYSIFKENKKFFYLIYGKYMFTIIPKRCFKDREEEKLFKTLVEEKLHK